MIAEFYFLVNCPFKGTKMPFGSRPLTQKCTHGRKIESKVSQCNTLTSSYKYSQTEKHTDAHTHPGLGHFLSQAAVQTERHIVAGSSQQSCVARESERKQDIVKQPCHISPTAATHALPQPLQTPHYKLRLKGSFFCVCVLYICFSYLPEKGRQEQVIKFSPAILLKQGFGSGSVGAPGGTGTIDCTSWLQRCSGPSTSVTRPTPVCKDSWFSASERRKFACWVCLQLAHQNLPVLLTDIPWFLSLFSLTADRRFSTDRQPTANTVIWKHRKQNAAQEAPRL